MRSTQLSKIVQSGGFLGRLPGPLLKKGLPLIKDITEPLAKSFLIHLGLTAAASAADEQIHKKLLGSGRRHSSSSAPHKTTLIISNDEMKDLIEIVKSLEDSSLLLNGVSETIQNESKEQKGGFLSMSLGTLSSSLLENILAGKGAIVRSQRRGVNRAEEEIVRAGYGNKKVRKTTTKSKNNF